MLNNDTAEWTSTLRYEDGNWITGTVGPFQVQAKAYTEPSEDYGMAEDKRISKLWVALGLTPHRTTVYNYDRGPDADTNYVTDEGLATVVAAVAKVIR